MTQHPSSLALESYACGEALPPDLLAHVEQCDGCGAFVRELRGLVAAGPSLNDADAAVARALESEAPVTGLRARESAPAANTGTPTPARMSHSKRKLWMIATSVVTPLAAAAAIILLARSTPEPDLGKHVDTTSTPLSAPRPGAPAAPPAPPDTVQMGTLPPRASRDEPDTRFKGGMQIAVVRERGGQQTRFSSTVPVRPGDRLRVEVALDREQAILGAVLADDGSYLELMPEAVRGAGTYFSERSAKIDATPTRGTIVIGSPEAVARARATKQLDGVAAQRVEWETP